MVIAVEFGPEQMEQYAAIVHYPRPALIVMVSEVEGRDELLAARLVAGDEGALDDAFTLYAPVVFGLARRVTGSVSAAEDVRARLMSAALSARSPGQSSLPVERISGHEVFRRSVEQLDGLLADLTPAEWTRPALRDLDVQGLMGHLIGVESAFSAGLAGAADPAGGAATGEADHVASTQPTALAQAGRPPGDTHRDWFQEASHSLALLEERADHHQLCNFYGIVLPLDQVLVVRGFEMWIHDEDIRRATGRPLERPDAGRLARMSELAVALLPAGVARVGGSDPGTVRLVLTGTGGGTWDVPLDGGRPGHQAGWAGARVVVDVAQFCRVAGDRTDQTGAGAVVTGEATLVATLLAGAASLALD